MRELRKRLIGRIVVGIFAIIGLLLVYLKEQTFLVLGCTIFVIILFGGEFFFRKVVDETFIANATKPCMTAKDELNEAEMLVALEKKQKNSIRNVLFVAIVWILMWGGVHIFSNHPLTLSMVILLLFPALIALVIIMILRQLNKRLINNIHNQNYIIYLCHVGSKLESSDEGASSYSLNFRTKDYGEFSYSVSREVYLRTKNNDEYYLVLLPKRKPRKYKLLEIYSTEKYHPSDDLQITQFE